MQTTTIAGNAILQVTKKGAIYTGNAGSRHNTARTWGLVQKHLKAHPKTTRQQLFALLQTQYNHACFVQYALQRGWLAPKG